MFIKTYPNGITHYHVEGLNIHGSTADTLEEIRALLVEEIIDGASILTQTVIENEDLVKAFVSSYAESHDIELTYGCDRCGDRKDKDKDIIWITAHYGMCSECFEETDRDELDTIEVLYE